MFKGENKESNTKDILVLGDPHTVGHMTFSILLAASVSVLPDLYIVYHPTASKELIEINMTVDVIIVYKSTDVVGLRSLSFCRTLQ